MVGSDGQQTRWSLIFVVATIVFYELSINRQREIEETHIHPGGRSPRWVRYLALGVTIAALAATFWISVGRHRPTPSRALAGRCRERPGNPINGD